MRMKTMITQFDTRLIDSFELIKVLNLNFSTNTSLERDIDIEMKKVALLLPFVAFQKISNDISTKSMRLMIR